VLCSCQPTLHLDCNLLTKASSRPSSSCTGRSFCGRWSPRLMTMNSPVHPLSLQVVSCPWCNPLGFIRMNEVSGKTVQKCFLRCGFAATPEDECDDDDIAIAELVTLMKNTQKKMTSCSEITPEEFLTIDEDIATCEEFGKNWEAGRSAKVKLNWRKTTMMMKKSRLWKTSRPHVQCHPIKWSLECCSTWYCIWARRTCLTSFLHCLACKTSSKWKLF